MPPDPDPPFPADPLPPEPLPPELLVPEPEPPLAFVPPLPDHPPAPLPPLPPLSLLGPAHDGDITAAKRNPTTLAAKHELLLLITEVPLVATRLCLAAWIYGSAARPIPRLE